MSRLFFDWRHRGPGFGVRGSGKHPAPTPEPWTLNPFSVAHRDKSLPSSAAGTQVALRYLYAIGRPERPVISLMSVIAANPAIAKTPMNAACFVRPSAISQAALYKACHIAP